MKKSFLLLLVLSFGLFAHAQDSVIHDAAHYSNLYAKLYKSFAKEPDNVENMLNLALFYADSLNPMRNYPMAVKYITTAEKRYIAMVEDRDQTKEVRKLIKKKITVILVRDARQRIVQQARNHLATREELPEKTLDSYAEVFSDDPSAMRQIEYRRMLLKYKKTKEENTLEAYRKFYNTYSATAEGEEALSLIKSFAIDIAAEAKRESQVDSLLADYLDLKPVQQVAAKRKSAIAYARLIENPSPQAYRAFLSKYPGSDEYSLVLKRMELVAKDDFSKLSTPREFADFAINNPDNPLAEKAIDNIKQMIRNDRDMEALSVYVKEFQLDEDYQNIYLECFNWHTEEGNRSPIARFAQNNPDFPFRRALEDALKEAQQYDTIDINIPFVEKEFGEWASKIYHLTGKKESFVALQRTLQHFIAAKEWNKALERIDFFELSFEENCVEEVAQLKSLLSSTPDSRLVLTPVVRPAYDMRHPILHPDGKRLFYNRTVDGIDQIHCAAKTEGRKGAITWRGTGSLVFTNFENKGLHIFNLFADGKKMLLGHNGKILIAEEGPQGWTVTETLPAPVNSNYCDFDACLLPDGSGILFASDRPGGKNLQPSKSYFHGDTALASDIYFAPKTAKGWGKPINLGKNVNSPYMECCPIISNDLKTLYFISDGTGGLGYGDIYYSTRDDVSDWTSWSKPVNYGKETNSGFNESSIALNADGKNLTVCSNLGGHYGCYSVPTVNPASNSSVQVSFPADGYNITFDILEAATQKVIFGEQKISKDSVWKTTLDSKKSYLLLTEIDGLLLPAIIFVPTARYKLDPVAYDRNTLLDMAKENKSLRLPAMLFEKNSAAMLPSAVIETAHLANLLTKYQNTSLEIIVHVDGIDDTFCYNLSQARGQEIKNMLVSKGINPDRIAVSPYGNSKTKHTQAKSSVAVMLH